MFLPFDSTYTLASSQLPSFRGVVFPGDGPFVLISSLLLPAASIASSARRRPLLKIWQQLQRPENEKAWSRKVNFVVAVVFAASAERERGRGNFSPLQLLWAILGNQMQFI